MPDRIVSEELKLLERVTRGLADAPARQFPSEESLITEPGQPPPPVFADGNEPVVSVVMERNLGNLRLRPALVTIGSFLIFAALCYMLHERDKIATQRVADFEAGKA